MTVQTITDHSLVRSGDDVTLNLRGHRVTGPAWEEDGVLFIGDRAWRLADGNLAVKTEFISAVRDVHPPTERWSIIRDVLTQRGVAVMGIRTAHAESDLLPWALYFDQSSVPGMYVSDDSLTAWTTEDGVRHERVSAPQQVEE